MPAIPLRVSSCVSLFSIIAFAPTGKLSESSAAYTEIGRYSVSAAIMLALISAAIIKEYTRFIMIDFYRLT